MKKYSQISCLSCLSWFFSFCLVATWDVAVVNPSAAAEPTPAQRLVLADRPLVIAHRGNSSVAPENTLPAFLSALEAKADLVELDYFHSSDGVPVVIHDEILDRTTDVEAVLGQTGLVVGNMTLADLQKLDAGAWFDDKFAGTRLPTLVQALDLIQSRSVTLIERKAGDAKTLVRLLADKQLTEKVVVQSFDWNFVAECRQLAPTMALAALCGKPANEEQIRAAAATGADVIAWDHKKIGRPQIELIHSLGKKAWVYTVDEPQIASALVAAGINGIITNKPAEMMQVRSAERGVRSKETTP